MTIKPMVVPYLALAFWMWVAPVLPAATLQGVVYEDQNKDRQRGETEPGVANVHVSNGIDVVLTDGEGRYQIEVPDRCVVFITKPTGYATPLNDRMLPQFYYIHQPAGSPPGLRYAGLEPTGPLPDRVDFPLIKQDELKQFEAVLFADTQPQTEAELDYMRDDVIVELIGTKAVFGMTMGDIMFDDLSLFPRYNAIIAQIGVPWYNVPGNHELNYLAVSDGDSLETFKRYYGPPYYSFQYANVHFVVMDNIVYKGRAPTEDGAGFRSGGYEARITDDQLQWLANDLAHVPPEKLVFLAMHSPLQTYLGDSSSLNTVNRRALFELLAGRPNLYAVAGHTHTTEHHYFDEKDGFPGPGVFHHHVLSTVSGSWWSGPIDERGIAAAEQRDGTPNGYHILEVDDVRVTARYKAAGKSASYQMRILFDVAHRHDPAEVIRDFRPDELLDSRIDLGELSSARVIVNLFDGGPNSTVALSVDGRSPAPMTRHSMPDPHTQELFARHEDTKKSWVEATPCSHLWMAELPKDLSAGTYTVTVTAVDEFGRTHHGHRILEIVGSGSEATAIPPTQ